MSNIKMRKSAIGGSNPPEWVLNKFRRGLNTLVSDTRVNVEETPRALNVNYTEDGLPTKRGGTALHRTEIGSRIRGLASYYKDDGTDYMIAAANGTLYYDNGSAWAHITCASGATVSPNIDYNFVQARDYLYAHDGQGLKRMEGTTMTAQTNGVSGDFGIYWKGRHVVAGNESYPSRVFISRNNDAGHFITTGTDTSAEWFDVQPSDGDKVKSVATFYDNLVIFKERSIHKAVPSNSTGDFVSSVQLINNDIGCVAHRTVDTVDNDVFFLSRKGVYVLGNEPNFFDTIRTNEVSARVHPEIEGITPANFGLTSAMYHNYKYYMAYPFGGTTYNNRVLVYDTRYGAWSLHTGYNPNCFNTFIDSTGTEALYCGDDNAGKVLKMESGTADSGSSINSNFYSPNIDLEAPDIKKFFMDATIQTRNTQASLDVDVYIDGEVYKSATFNIGTTGSSSGLGTKVLAEDYLALSGGSTITTEVTSNILKRFRLKHRGKNIQIKVSNDSTTDSWTLMSLRGSYRPLSHFVFDSDDKI